MTTATGSTTTEITIACSLSAAELAERKGEFKRLLASADDVRELAGGYALRFPNDAAWITRATQLIVAERECCPFFAFSLVFEPGNGPVWLHIEGPGEVKTMIGEQWVPESYAGLLVMM